MAIEQYVVGLNGFSRLHNASAAILKNGELIAMAEEERFTRKKHAYGEIPYTSLAYCLSEAGITLDDVDIVGLGYDFVKRYSSANRTPPTREEFIEAYFPHSKFRYSRRPRIEMVPHHLAHAASAFYLSGFDNSAILVIDGQGEDQSTSFFYGKEGKLTLLREFPVSASLGYFYQAVSEFIGLNPQEPGKTMGLAAYGNPIYPLAPLEITDEGYHMSLKVDYTHQEIDQYAEVTQTWKQYLESMFGTPNEAEYIYNKDLGRLVKRLQLGQLEKDIAASAQARLEDVVLNLLSILKGQTGSGNLCIAGGVGLNCSMNGRVAREGVFSSIFVPPFTDDSGVGLGAALYLSDQKPFQKLRHAYYGPLFNDQQILTVLNDLGVPHQYQDDIAKKAAMLLAQGNIVSWFQGKMEVGPRALGNRSILADPRKADSHTITNTVKNREMWRPLAPSFLEADMQEYVQHEGTSPFMLKAYLVEPARKDLIPAVVHVDGTLRPQSVNPDANPLFYHLIEEFKNLSGVAGVLNTSFNQDSEPIVCSPLDALRSFLSSRANYLAIGNFLVAK